MRLSDPLEKQYTPVFSIITPTFKRPELLTSNIQSVIGQTFSNYEHIIIDDAVDNETARLVSGFSDDRIVFMRHDKPRGAAASYNTGIRSARGKFILFLDDDDEYLPSCLEKIHARFSISDESTGFIWTGISRVRDTDSGEILLHSLIWSSAFKNKEDGLVAATSIGNGFGVCVRRECIDNIGLYDEDLVVGTDTDFMFRLAMNYNFETIPEALVKIHQHSINQLTGKENNTERIRAREVILARYNDFLKKHPKVFSAHYSAYADLCYKSGFRKKGRRAIFSIITTCPLRILTYPDFIAFEFTGQNAAGTKLARAMIWVINFIKSKIAGE